MGQNISNQTEEEEWMQQMDEDDRIRRAKKDKAGPVIDEKEPAEREVPKPAERELPEPAEREFPEPAEIEKTPLTEEEKVRIQVKTDEELRTRFHAEFNGKPRKFLTSIQDIKERYELLDSIRGDNVPQNIDDIGYEIEYINIKYPYEEKPDFELVSIAAKTKGGRKKTKSKANKKNKTLKN